MNLSRFKNPATVAVVAIVAGLLIGWLAFFNGDDDTGRAINKPDPGSATPTSSSSASPSAAPELKSDPVVSRKGGFAVKVPEGLNAKQSGPSVYMASEDRSIVIIVGPSRAGTLQATNKFITKTMRSSYKAVAVSGNQPQKVNGRAGLSTYGVAVNKKGTRVRFVQLTVKARPRNFTIATYAAADSDPAYVLPRVNAVANSFTVHAALRPVKPVTPKK